MVHDFLSESEVVVLSFFASLAVSFVVVDCPYVTLVFDGLTFRFSMFIHPTINRAISKMINLMHRILRDLLVLFVVHPTG